MPKIPFKILKWLNLRFMDGEGESSVINSFLMILCQ